MAVIRVSPVFDKPSVTYRHKLSWVILEQYWTLMKHCDYILELESEIPGTYKTPGCRQGGLIHFAGNTRELYFTTFWPVDIKSENICVEAVFSLKKNDGETSTDYGIDKNLVFKPVLVQGADNYMIMNFVSINVKPEDFFDQSRSCKFEAELLVEFTDPVKVNHFKKPNTYLENMKSIEVGEVNSDIVIVSGNKEFKCHKNILIARCEVFKRMLSKDYDFLESANNRIHVKDVPDEAVGEMLKHLYTGDIPDDPSVLTKELLQLSAMYEFDSLKAACLENLISSLGIDTCISTFIMVDRYVDQNSEDRDYVLAFLLCKSEQVVKCDDWDQLVAAAPSVVDEIYKAIESRRMADKRMCQWYFKS